MTISLRRAAARDAAYGWLLYRSSIRPLAMLLGAWNEADEQRVVEDAFRTGEASLIIDGRQPVGWAHTRWTPQALELWQLFVSPEHRGRGVGRVVLLELQRHAQSAGLPILLAVLHNNRARRLYERMGFRRYADGPHHFFLCWTAAQTATSVG